MSRLVLVLVVAWLSSTTAQLQFLSNLTRQVTNGISKEITAIADPIEKTIVHIGFSQCRHVKRLLGVDYESYNNTEPDMSYLTLNFVSRAINVTYKLTAAAELIPHSPLIDPRKPLKIYLHGFTDNPFKDSFSSLNNAFLEKGDINILALDASSLIKWLYLRSTTMVRFIGEELGKLLAALVHAGLQPSNIHLIGHSLGCHISGFTGKTFTTLTGLRVGRISGLDPAGPCFADVNETLRLHSNDADFVDVIHTDAGVYGIDNQIGHADFYPNSGSAQPGCLPTHVIVSCSHSRAWELFAESVSKPDAFVAASCKDWQTFRDGKCNYNDTSLMGYGCQPGAKGTYYLRTGEDSPYGLGADGVKYVNNEGIIKNLGRLLG